MSEIVVAIKDEVWGDVTEIDMQDVAAEDLVKLAIAILQEMHVRNSNYLWEDFRKQLLILSAEGKNMPGRLKAQIEDMQL